MEICQNFSKSHAIPVIFGLNLNYIKPMCVTISSLLRHSQQASDMPLEVYILIDSIPEEMQRALSIIFRKLGAHLTFLEVSLLETKGQNSYHFTEHMYYRYLIPQIFSPVYEKALYLDADTLAQGNVFSIFNGMGAEDALAVKIEGNGHRYLDAETICDTYFNSGVIGFNFKNLPENFLEKCQAYSKPHYQFGDQDALNAFVLKEKIKIFPLPAAYNLTHNEQADFPIIIHYIGPDKPWIAASNPYTDRWHQERNFFIKALLEKAPETSFPLIWNALNFTE